MIMMMMMMVISFSTLRPYDNSLIFFGTQKEKIMAL